MVKCIVPGGVWNKNNYEFSLVLGECLIVCKDSGGAQRPPIVLGWHGPTVQDISNSRKAKAISNLEH